MTRPRQHWRRVKTKEGIVPRVINRGVMWIKRHFSRNETVGDTTEEQAQEALFRGTQYGKRREVWVDDQGKPHPILRLKRDG